MQIRILPILPLAFALQRRAMEMDLPVVVHREANIVAGEQVFALRAEAHFPERPPVFQRVSGLKELQFSSDGFRK